MKKILILLAFFSFSHFVQCQEFDTRFEIEVDRYGENFSLHLVKSHIVGIRSVRKKTLGNNRDAEYFVLKNDLSPEIQNTFTLPDNQDFQWVDVSGDKLVLLTHYPLKVIQSTINELTIVTIDAASGQLSMVPFISADLSEIEDFHSFENSSLILGRNAAGLMLQTVDHLKPEILDRKILFDNSYKFLSVNKWAEDKSLTVLVSKKDYWQKDILHMLTVSEKGEIIEKGSYDLLQDKRTNFRYASVLDFKGERFYAGVFGPRNNNHSSGLVNALFNEFEEFTLWRTYLNELPGFFEGENNPSPLSRKKRMDRRLKIGRVPVLNETLQLWALQPTVNGVWQHYEQFSAQLKEESDYQRKFINSFTRQNKYFPSNRFTRELPQIPGGYKEGTKPFRLSSEYLSYAAHLIHVDESHQVTNHFRIPLSSDMQFLPIPSGSFFQTNNKVKYSYFDGRDILASSFEDGVKLYLNKAIPFYHDQKNIEPSSIKLIFDHEGSLLVFGKGRINDVDGNRKTAFFVERYKL
ncbi:hypothetical protein [Mongoliibacter ruber]|uniref:Uncharacterized protein n=1 Tax=Mongoliibacter ruber TaxID=1750599 RepID=A0A2T0WPM4_9BACT|nr:hypothetical protein [Mongoliibacter ruber]PRY88474.1 hypothetical protein CLW00_104125 [Mongoliibacter ruber]